MASVATGQEGQETHQGKQCCLCGRREGYMTRFERWSEKERQYLLRYLSKSPPSNSVTCKKDRVEAKRYYDTPDHIPKWKNTQDTTAPTQVVHTCIHPGCNVTSNMTKYTDISFKMHTKRVFPAAKDHVACVGDTIMNSIVIYIVLLYILHVVQGPKQAQDSPSTHQMHT